MADDNGNVLTDIEPGSIRHVHLVGVAGTGMGSFAGMLKAKGYEVTGSDENVYPQMSDRLAAWGVGVMTPYAPENIDRAKPDLVIIGNVIRRVNVEATAVRERGIPQISFPAAFGSLVLAGRHSVVVTGTHGKTTVSALLSHVLVSAGTDPTFLVGGVTLNYDGNFRVGAGPYVVVEGDEYDTAYFDKGPKFMHYRAQTAMLTSVEFDHADIYRDLAHYESAFDRFASTLPEDGFLVIDDFAHHPTAVRETIGAIRLRYPDRRLWAVFEPRSNTSRRNIHQALYSTAFDAAHAVSIRVPEPHDKVPLDEQLDVAKVVAALRAKGIDANASRDVPELVALVADAPRPGDAVLVMSNGSFGGFIPSLLGALRHRSSRA